MRFEVPGAVSAERTTTLASARRPDTFQAIARRLPPVPRFATQATNGSETPIQMSTFAPSKVIVFGTRPSCQS